MEDLDEYAAISRELGMFLRRATRLHERRGDQPGHGLDRAAYMLLSRLMTDGPARLSALAGDMCVDLSVVSRQVAALEAAGLVTRAPDPGDRRASLISVSAAGTALFTRRREQFRALLLRLLADWSPDERVEFARLLGRFNAAFAAHDEGKETWVRR